MHTSRWMAIAVAGLLLAGCAGQDPDPPQGQEDPVIDDAPDDPSADDDADAPDAGEAGSGGTGDDAAAGSDAVLGEETMEAIDQLVDDGVDRDDILVVTAEFVTWSDGSLGCPEPDMMYTQALVEGYRIVLDVAGDEVAFHGARGDVPARCDDPQPPAAGGDV